MAVLPNKSPGDYSATGTYTAANFNSQINPLYTWGQATVDGHIAATAAHGVTDIVGEADAASLSNKTLVAAVLKSDQLVTETNSRVLTFPTGANDTMVALTSTDTLTNKTLTAPDINAGTWNGTIDGTWTAASQTCTDMGTVTTADINGGTVDGVTIGGTTPAAGTFSDGAMYGQPLMLSKTIVLPEYVEDAVGNFLPILPVEAGAFPYGILITKFGIKTDADTTYSVVLEDWSDPQTHSADISTVATSASDEAASAALTTTVAAGNIVGVDLPTTTGVKSLQVWIEYEIKAS